MAKPSRKRKKMEEKLICALLVSKAETEENPDSIGKIDDIEQAFPRIMYSWRLYGKKLEFR